MRNQLGLRSVTDWAWMLLVAVLCIGLAACAPARTEGSSGQPDVLRIVGDSALGDLPQSLVNAYEAQSQAGSITYRQVDRAQILTGIQSGEFDAAFLMHPPDDRTMFATAVGFQPLAIVTPTDLNVDSLTEGDVRAIFSGRKANWADVEGPDLPIGTVLPFALMSERVAFQSLIMQHEPLSLSALLAATPSQMAGVIGAAPGRVGIMAGNATPQGLKALAINGADVPNADQARNTYPLIVIAGYVAVSEPRGEAKAFLDWILSQDGQSIVSNYALPVN